MRRTITILCVATLIFSASSCSKMYLSKGKQDMLDLKYTDAIESLERSVEKKPNTEASTLLATAYAKTHQPVAAVYEFDKIKTDPNFNDELKLEYAAALLGAEKYDEALEVANGILSRDAGNEVAQSVRISVNRLDKMKKDSSLYEVKPFAISELETAMSPVLYNGGLLVSGEKRNRKVKDSYTGLSFLDLYQVSDSGKVDKLSLSNTKFHDGMASLDKNGQTIYFTRTNQSDVNDLEFNADNVSHPQLYTSTKSGDSWSTPSKLSFNDANYIFAHPVISSDGNTLYFASNKPGGVGAMDLYKVQKNGANWGQPENLGPTINTQGNDAFPTLKDDQTLYFSSDAHQTLGGLDILYSSNSNGTWSPPVQLSYPLNSPLDDFGAIYTSKDEGYLSSDRSGKDQIYSFKQFYPELAIDGSITDSETGEPISSMQVILKNLTDNTSEILTSDEYGKFNFELLPNKEYELVTEDLSEDQVYFNSTKKISTMGLRETETFDVDFNLEQIKTPEDPTNIQPGEDGTYPIPNIYWDYNKWVVRTDAEPYLNMLTDLLKTNPGLKVEIRSHCDSRGSDKFNKDLSKKRAKAVLKYLVANGIDRHRLSSNGVGEKELLNDCSDGVACTEKQHQENRRSEFIVTDKSGNKKKID